MPGYAGDKEQVRARLRRIEGQVRGLQRLVDEDAYCIDVLTQISAVDKALKGVAVGLLDGHLRHCVRDGMAAGDRDAEAIVGRGHRRRRPAGARLTRRSGTPIANEEQRHGNARLPRRPRRSGG